MEREDLARIVKGVRDAEVLRRSAQDTGEGKEQGNDTCSYVRCTGPKNTYAKAYPGVLVYRNLEVADPFGSGAFIDGEAVMIEEVFGRETIVESRIYRCDVWGIKKYTNSGSVDEYSVFVKVDDGSSFYARVTTKTGDGVTARWKWVKIVYDSSYLGTNKWRDYGSESSDFTAVPVPRTGTSYQNIKTGDRVLMVPSSRSKKYYEAMKVGSTGIVGDQECSSCAWLNDIDPNTCWVAYRRGGNGRCSCFGEDDPADPDAGIPMAFFSGSGGGEWIGTKMIDTCCGCGSIQLNITGGDEPILKLHNVHVSCAGGSGGSEIFTLELTKFCCGVLPEDGRPFIEFIGWGPKTCDEDLEPCDNTFRILVACNPCPPVVCGCCCADPSPPAWFLDAGLPSDWGGTATYAGDWVFPHTTDCTWTATCGELTSTITFDGTDYVLSHGGSVYKLASGSFLCWGDNSMPRVSGSGPAGLLIKPIIVPVPVFTPACDWPNSLSMTTHSATCPVLDGATRTVTRVTPTRWEWNAAPGSVGVIAMSLECNGGVWSAFAEAVCDRADPDSDLTFHLNTQGIPDSIAFAPVEISWSGAVIDGADPSPVADCCSVDTNATVSVVEV